MSSLLKIAASLTLLASLTACTVVPAGHVGYRSGPVYVDSYPTYRTYPGTTTYYYYDNDRHGHRGHDRGYDRRYDERRYDDRPSRSMPLPPPLQLHRDVRRSLGLRFLEQGFRSSAGIAELPATECGFEQEQDRRPRSAARAAAPTGSRCASRRTG